MDFVNTAIVLGIVALLFIPTNFISLLTRKEDHFESSQLDQLYDSTCRGEREKDDIRSG